MVLYKLDEYNPNYRSEVFKGYDITHFNVYAGDGQDKVGSIDNILVDESGRFRYFIVDTGSWVFGKKVLLPIAMAQLNYDNRIVSVSGLTKQQVEDLPEFTEALAIDHDYEESIRDVYRPLIATPMLGMAYNPLAYNYQQEPYFYDYNDPQLRDYERRIMDR
jgi:PRC-barrel domain